ncbi:MAG: hypothetical protein WKG01_41810 [Kofleriaceae bacterium]
MNRRFAHLMMTIAIALAGCQQAATTEATQDLTSCTPGGNFPGATMPPVPFFQPGQQLPYAEPGKAGWVAFQRTDGNWVAALGNVAQGQVTHAVQVKPSGLGNLVTALSLAGQLDVVRPPPGPRPLLEAAFVLEYMLRSLPLYDEADAASRQ